MRDDALYNEIDPFAADWLENLIAAGQIAPGVVDRRSIEDLEPAYVRQFRQVHLFAGIGIWSLALRRAGWPDGRRVLTGSCPCQPFSQAGQGAGFADERHLWPAMLHLATQCDFGVVLGEQVASKDGLGWLDLVHADMEAAGYAFGAVDICAAGLGAPHIRQRLNWCGVAMGDADDTRLEIRRDRFSRVVDAQGREATERFAGLSGVGVGLADASGGEQPGRGIRGPGQGDGAGARPAPEQRPAGLCADDRLADDNRTGRSVFKERHGEQVAERQAGQSGTDVAGCGELCGAGPVNSGWRAADWLWCRDGKWRPVEPGTFPLAHALPRSVGAMGPRLRGLVDMAGLDRRSLAAAKRFRTGTLRGFGNAVVLEQTEHFVATVMEYLNVD